MGGVLSSLLMPMQIVSAPITRDELRRIAGQQFGDFVKAGVDVQGGTNDELIEFDSMINVRPAQGNRSRGVDDAAVQALIRAIVGRLVAP